MKLFIAVFLLCLCQAAPAASFTVAPSGNDAADGTPAHPFATPSRARQAAREALRRGETAEVILRAGTYEMAEPLHFGPEDSGTAGRQAVWRAAAGEEVRLSGGQNLQAWKTVADPAVLARLDGSVRTRVLEISLRDLGITDYGEMGGGFGKAGSTGLEIFVDDLPTRPARYPNQGFIKITEVLGPTPVDIRGTKGTAEGIFRIADPRAAKWTGEKDGRALGYWFWDWAEEHQKIASIDPGQLAITLEKPWHSTGYRKDQYFYAYNLLCELDQPGEWYLDRENGMLYLLPPVENPKRILATLRSSILHLEGASDISFQGLILEGARGHAVVAGNCGQVEIKDCILRNCGKWAVQVNAGKAVAIRSCEIYGTGEGGVSLQGGDRRALSPSNHVVENCRIHDYARWSRTYQPGIRLEGTGSRAAHNLIYNAPHQAIGLAGNDHRIEFNEIYQVCQESNDAGAIYAWNDWAGRGNQIHHNYLHDIAGQNEKGAHGVYLDDGFSSASITGNIFKSVSGAILLGGGRDITVANNLFINCSRSIQIDARGLGWRAYGFKELKDKLEQWPYQSPPWSERYPELVRLLEEDPMAPKGVVVKRNILVRSGPLDIEEKARPWVALEKNLPDAPPDVLLAGAKEIPRADSANPLVQAIGFDPASPEKIGWQGTLPGN